MANYDQLINAVVNNKAPDGSVLAGRNSYSAPFNASQLRTAMQTGYLSSDNYNKVISRLGPNVNFDPSASSIVIGGDTNPDLALGPNGTTAPASGGTPIASQLGAISSTGSTYQGGQSMPTRNPDGSLLTSNSNTTSSTLKGNPTQGNGYNYGSPDIGYFKTYGEATAALNSPVSSQLGAVQNNTSSGSTNSTGSGTINTTAPTSTTDLENQYQSLIGPSPDEISAQNAIDNQNNGTMVGETNIEDQPIAASFISGQNASLEKRNTEALIPLNQRLANAQQKRQASIDAVQFELTRADAAQARQDKLDADSASATAAANKAPPTQVIDVNGKKELINSNTGEVISNLGASTTGAPTAAETARVTAQNQANDIASAVVDFETQIKQRGWAGANPDAYNHYRSELISQYGATAALALDKAMADAGITVDYTNK